MESLNPAAHDQKPSEPVAPEEGGPALYVSPKGGIPGPSGPPAPSGNPLSGGLTPWSSSLFGCFGDVGSCML